EGESTEYSYCELQARMILSRRRKPLVVMQADLIGGSVENIYTELNQGSTDFVFAGGSWEIKPRCISGTWSELLPVDLTACSVTICRKASSAQGSV
ncbi:hypothetical protein JZU71_01180, partial [bacterium]|nr:hypothetical protein [bacterium]